MNCVFPKYLDSFVMGLIDGILVYSANHQVWKENLKTVLEVLREMEALSLSIREVCLFRWERYHFWVMLSLRMAMLYIRKG